jgi:hypothetical protein
MMQSVKLKEITIKAKGGAAAGPRRPFAAKKGFGRRPPSGAAR